MANARSICSAALRKLGALSLGQTAEEAELDDCMSALNIMLSSWSLETLMAYYWKTEQFTLAGASSYTIGSGGDFNTVRPLMIKSAFITEGGIDTFVDIVRDVGKWSTIIDKDITGTPYALYYEPQNPLGIIHLFPVGDASAQLSITSQFQFSEFPDLDTDVEFPPGYERAFIYNLAIEIAPEEEQEPSGAVIKIASESRANIKRLNAEAPEMVYDNAIPTNNRFNIETGQ